MIEKTQVKKKTSLFGEESKPDTPIVMWKAVSAIEHGHKAPIKQLQWIPAGTEINQTGAGKIHFFGIYKSKVIFHGFKSW